MKKNITNLLLSLLLIVNGIICLFNNEFVLSILPTLCGIIILVRGIIKLFIGIKDKDYATPDKTNLEGSIISVAIGAGILLMQQDALSVVAIFWGLSGLVKASASFNEVFYKLYSKKKCLLPIVEGIVGLALSMMLIFNPSGSIEHHVILLGIELIFEGVINIINKKFDDDKETEEAEALS